MKLLIVDDNRSMRRLIRALLSDLAESIAECGDGADAEFSYAKHQPDWVLMDLMMPRLDGLTATRKILAANATARVVLVTDHESQFLREAAWKAGACGYVVKENLLDLRRLFSATEGPPSPARGGPELLS